MITKIKKYIHRANTACCGIAAVLVSLTALTACSDFFNQESEHVIFTDNEHLNNATDTIYSVTGILTKLQALADRTVLLGEARGDLVDITNVTNMFYGSSSLNSDISFSISSFVALGHPFTHA